MRKSNDAAFTVLLASIAGRLQESNLVLAELSGIPVEDRRAAARRMQSICDDADADSGAVVRALRENYLTPFDRRDIYVLADTLRTTCHRLDSVGFALTSPAFEELPVGVLEMLALLSNQADHTLRMTQRLSAKLDQWEYVETMNTLHSRAVKLQQRVTDAVPAARLGLTHLAAAMQLSEAFMAASQGFTSVGRVVAEIAVRES
ncbi:DUF47 domain-containing protein [Brevibacterium sp. BRM-1]|uniref:DUF47 domain-containing protein n=1 Tax=Brevibacterium sp. BRM-1 TaxID=2999062 RepID=UPI002280F586|nr:DUF47 domain-containing protein [Brevibacterium sp. BRM-1]WAL39948.1 DUF47 domain-containing protein [Brevibacterium sp. BRM-1]